MGSPDARFILEAIDAAVRDDFQVLCVSVAESYLKTELLHFCVEKLRPSGAMSYLPWRFFLYSQSVFIGIFFVFMLI